MSGVVPGWEGRVAEEWARLLGLERLELHRSLPSTNDRARELARAGAPALSAVVAGSQTAGRGRGGRPWRSPEGVGLWISFVLGGTAGGMGGPAPLAVGAGAAEALEEAAGLVPGTVGVKWPNDLLIEGRKVGGVLCEAERAPAGTVVVAGIGVNLRRPAGELSPGMEGAGFLEEAAGREVTPPALTGALAAGLRRWADPLPERLEGPLAEILEARDRLRGLEVLGAGGLHGRADGLEPDGRLRVVDAEGRVHRIAGGGVRVRDREGQAEPRAR